MSAGIQGVNGYAKLSVQFDFHGLWTGYITGTYPQMVKIHHVSES